MEVDTVDRANLKNNTQLKDTNLESFENTTNSSM